MTRKNLVKYQIRKFVYTITMGDKRGSRIKYRYSVGLQCFDSRKNARIQEQRYCRFCHTNIQHSEGKRDFDNITIAPSDCNLISRSENSPMMRPAGSLHNVTSDTCDGVALQKMSCDHRQIRMREILISSQ